MFMDTGPSESRRRFESAVAVITGGSKGIGLAIALVKAALAAGMHEARGAAVVISSIGARLTNPTIGAYDAAKAALNSLMRALARELGTRGVRLNLVSPGLIATPSAQVVLT